MTRLAYVLVLLAACGGKTKDPGLGNDPGAGGRVAGEPVPDGVWMWTAPIQAGNPWDGVQAGDTETVGYPIDELEAIDSFFEAKGIDLLALGLVWPTEPIAVCAALSCPRGDKLLVIARAADRDRLAADYKFTVVPSDSLHVHSSPQCETPWGPPGAPTDEALHAAQWASDAGAPPKEVGFLYPTEKSMRAQACGMPRGDWLILVGP